MTTNYLHLAAIELVKEEIACGHEAIRSLKLKGKARQREWETRKQYRDIKHDQRHRDIMRGLKLQRNYVAELERSLNTLRLHRRTYLRLEKLVGAKPF